ncbi:hypothetical protein SKAU_G00300700 [Synaphobranchus kaupii]|uniref:Uncharacterized protein n=1 Tax=Synaphobranchus kaupii TaxID=118154 RepID=A0A9Q1EVK5_SYNKA|nr:hypothetical protein SKAU_G00300700 [Synaphobranchus kaupii]
MGSTNPMTQGAWQIRPPKPLGSAKKRQVRDRNTTQPSSSTPVSSGHSTGDALGAKEAILDKRACGVALESPLVAAVLYAAAVTETDKAPVACHVMVDLISGDLEPGVTLHEGIINPVLDSCQNIQVKDCCGN